MHREPITPEEIQYIKANFETLTDQQMADELKRTINAVKNIRFANRYQRFNYAKPYS